MPASKLLNIISEAASEATSEVAAKQQQQQPPQDAARGQPSKKKKRQSSTTAAGAAAAPVSSPPTRATGENSPGAGPQPPKSKQDEEWPALPSAVLKSTASTGSALPKAPPARPAAPVKAATMPAVVQAKAADSEHNEWLEAHLKLANAQSTPRAAGGKGGNKKKKGGRGSSHSRASIG